MGAVTIIPTALVLRRLLVRNSYPILNAIVILYFVGQLRILAASLPVLARFIFLGQVLGASIFLVWVLRSWRLPAEAAETHGRVWRTIRAIAKIGLIILPAAFLANIFGYVNLGNLLGIIFLRSVYIAAMLYTAIRIIEGLIIIALQVRPLGSLRVISLHRQMIQRRTCRVLEFLAFLFWLNVLLSFFGLRIPLNRVDWSGAEREPRNRLLQHYSGPHPGIPDHGLGFLSDLEILAFSAGRRRLSSFASRRRDSVRDLYDASLCHPAHRLLRRLGCARD